MKEYQLRIIYHQDNQRVSIIYKFINILHKITKSILLNYLKESEMSLISLVFNFFKLKVGVESI